MELFAQFSRISETAAGRRGMTFFVCPGIRSGTVRRSGDFTPVQALKLGQITRRRASDYCRLQPMSQLGREFRRASRVILAKLGQGFRGQGRGVVCGFGFFSFFGWHFWPLTAQIQEISSLYSKN